MTDQTLIEQIAEALRETRFWITKPRSEFPASLLGRADSALATYESQKAASAEPVAVDGDPLERRLRSLTGEWRLRSKQLSECGCGIAGSVLNDCTKDLEAALSDAPRPTDRSMWSREVDAIPAEHVGIYDKRTHCVVRRAQDPIAAWEKSKPLLAEMSKITQETVERIRKIFETAPATLFDPTADMDRRED